MTTYYNFEIWETGEMECNDKRLYEDFDELCDVADEILTKRNGNFVKPDRKAIKEELNNRPDRAVWYAHKNDKRTYGTAICIHQMTVVPKKLKQKKYVYQYYVRNDEQTEMKASPKYESFDEVCDVLDNELRKRHGSHWEPRMTREEYKKYMDDHTACAISYDFFKTDTYVLFWTEV